MSECEFGHTWHNDCLAYVFGDIKLEKDDDCYVHRSDCPFCTLQLLDREEELMAYRALSGISYTDLLSLIKKQYGDHKQFYTAVKEHRKAPPEASNASRPDFKL